MRVVSWNLGVAYAFKETHERAWHYLAALDPDLAFVQEVEPPAWAPERWTVEIGPHQFWGSAILAKSNLQLAPILAPPDSVLARFGSYLATGIVTLPDGSPLVVASVHTSAREAWPQALVGLDADAIRRPSVDVPWLNDLAYCTYRDLVAGRRFLISGDWNTGRLFDATYGTTCGAEFFERAATDGWIEIYRRSHDAEGRTWFRGRDRHYQLDHAFCDPATAGAVRACEIDAHPADTFRLSDHAPLVMDLDSDPAAIETGGSR